MSLDMFKGIVDDLHAMGTRCTDLIGRGEPLLNRNALEMIRYVKSRGMQMQMVTNGSRLFEPVAKGMVAAGADRVNVSLNAGSPENYPNIHVTESPEDYLKIKKNLRFLAACKLAAASEVPFISRSFVINSKNYFEIKKMVEVAHEVGAQETQFVHSVVHAGTRDLALSEAEFGHLQASLPVAIERAAELRVSGNLKTFAVTIPPYMASEVVGPPVVPCYVGWYFAVILGNGIGDALLPVRVTDWPGDEGSAVLGGLGLAQLLGFPRCGEVATREERLAGVVRVRQVPASAPQRDPAQLSAPAQ